MQPNLNVSIIDYGELLEMTKPEISELKHQNMLEKAIIKAKDKSILSWWWLSVPLYILAALLMKSLFIPSTTFGSNLHDLMSKEKYASILFFFVLPVFFIIINFMSVRKIYFLSGNPKLIDFLKVVWFNLLIIIASSLILLIYLL